MKTEFSFQMIKLLKRQQDMEALNEVMGVLPAQEEQETISLRLAIKQQE